MRLNTGKLNTGVLMVVIALSPGFASAADWINGIAPKPAAESENCEGALFDFPMSRALGFRSSHQAIDADRERTFHFPLVPYQVLPMQHQFDDPVAPIGDFPDKSEPDYWSGYTIASR
ncbi:hypothetical protein FHS27_005694 [Rhodopirellula rubra]|uniref:Uncharacterized protein n=1 Tax=Aporhodopirellula rubra TaxID=980271 RepID=A0A7W5E471_9BACT|nr:hypothetical protein [Aporhodopirellula rubra]MBB3209849.1 hypothetical protein [Aporhodopirellula rubra]